MATVTKAASSNTVVTTGWTSPTNAYGTSADGTFATAAPAKSSTVNSDYGFASFTTSDIPAGSAINSVTITVAWKLSNTAVGGTLGVQGRNNGVADSTAETTDTTSSAVTTKTFVFGTIPSAADLAVAGRVVARVRDSRLTSNTAHTGSLDFVSLTVDYTAPTTVSDSSSASVAEAATLAPAVSSSDSPSATEATNTVAAAVSDTQTVALADSPSVAAAVSSSDSATAADSGSVTAQQNVASSDIASQADTVAVAASVADMATLAASESVTAAAAATDSDIGSLAETAASVSSLADTDTGTATSSAVSTGQPSGSDSFSVADDGSAASQGSTQDIADTDTGAFADSLTLAAAAAAADVVAEAEAITLAAALADTDADALGETDQTAPIGDSATGDGNIAASRQSRASIGAGDAASAAVLAERESIVTVDAT